MTIKDLMDTIIKNQDSCDGDCDNCPLFIKEVPDCMLRDPAAWGIDVNQTTKTLELSNLIEDTVVYEIPKLKTPLPSVSDKPTLIDDDDDDEEEKQTKWLVIILNILCVLLVGIMIFIIYWLLCARGII